MWVVDKSLPRPNGHQDGYWSFQEASACALLCRFQIGPGQIGKCDMYGKHGKTDFISGGWNMMKLWFSDLWLDMPHWWLLNFENMSTNLAISRARSICWDELEPPSGSVFLVAVCVGIACRVAGSQITVRSIGHRRREHDYVPIRPVDGPGQSEMVLETEHAT